MSDEQVLESRIRILEEFQGFKSSLLKFLADETSSQVTLQMLEAFSQTVSGEIIQIESGLDAQDFEKLKKAFHKLAGTSELLGFPDHGRKWRTLSQELAKGQSMAQVENELKELRSLQSVLFKAIRCA